jgi:hypothetical protein
VKFLVNDIAEKLRLPNDRFISVVRRFVIALVLLFVPLAQIYSFLLALPLIVSSSIAGLPLISDKYWVAAFVWMYPNSPIPVIVFSIYFIVLFYAIERWVPKLGLRLFEPEPESERRKKLGYDK